MQHFSHFNIVNWKVMAKKQMYQPFQTREVQPFPTIPIGKFSFQLYTEEDELTRLIPFYIACAFCQYDIFCDV